MKINGTAATCGGLVLAWAMAADGQQNIGTGNQQSATNSETVTEHRYNGAVAPWREVQSRAESAGHEVVVDTDETAGPNGRMQPAQQTVTERTQTDAGVVRSRSSVFTFDLQGRRTLSETAESEQQPLSPDGHTSVRHMWVADINGHLDLDSRTVERSQSLLPGVRQTDTSVFRSDPDNVLRESERVRESERQTSSTDVRRDHTTLVRDINGRLVTTESHTSQTRVLGPSEQVTEDIIRRADVNGALTISEKRVVHHTATPRTEDILTETYSRDVQGHIRSDGLGLSQRTRISTTTTVDGGRHTVEEVEKFNPAAPGDPMRIVRRIVETTRKVTDGSVVTERQIFETDINGRLVPVATDHETRVEK